MKWSWGDAMEVLHSSVSAHTFLELLQPSLPHLLQLQHCKHMELINIFMQRIDRIRVWTKKQPMPHVHMDSACSQQQHSSHPSSSLFLAPATHFWYFSSLPDVWMVPPEALCCFLACSIRNEFPCGDTYGSASHVTPSTFKAPPEIVSDDFFELFLEDEDELRRLLRFASSDMAIEIFFQRQILGFEQLARPVTLA